jgi:hypothetical protein
MARGNQHQRGVTGMQMSLVADIVDQAGTTVAALAAVHVVHEVVDDQLTAPGEQIGQTQLTLRPLKTVIGLNLDHRQLAALGVQRIALLGQRLFFGQQSLAGKQPLLTTGNLGVFRTTHGQCSFSVV